MAGQFKDDPHFDEMLADIAAYRRELDAEAESHALKVDTPEQLKWSYGFSTPIIYLCCKEVIHLSSNASAP